MGGGLVRLNYTFKRTGLPSVISDAAMLRRTYRIGTQMQAGKHHTLFSPRRPGSGLADSSGFRR